MSDHNCPKHVRVFAPYYLGGYMDQVHPNVHCDVCEAKAKERYKKWLPFLAELRAWVRGDDDLSRACWEMLYEHFMDDLPYGVMTGDTGTIDEWLCDRPEYVEELADTVEYYWPEAVTA